MSILIAAENFTISAFETEPIGGYEMPVNAETGEQFPNCCPFHKSVFEHAKKWFEKFPNCYDPHTKYIGEGGFRKANYNGIAEKIVKQVSFTEHHISARIKNPDWYKDITDYVDYNVSSFGHPAVGVDGYLNAVKLCIQNTLSGEQRQRLSEFIDGYRQPNKTDLNLLISTYQKWFNEFPFEFKSYFGNLKTHFETLLPILNGKPETNIYSGMAKTKLHTKSSLIEALINLTINLITQINGVTLHEQGLITEADKIKLELVINRRKLKLKQGYTNSSPSEEQRYRKILKAWYKDEIKFFDDITPFLKAPPQQTDQEQPIFKNNFDNSTPDDVYKHFKAGLVDKKYLTKEELNEYLKAAFELEEAPEKRFKMKNASTKYQVMRVFYAYYTNIAGKPHRKAKNYAALLGEYFEGYETENVRTNFNNA